MTEPAANASNALPALRARLQADVQAGLLPGAQVGVWHAGRPLGFSVGWLDAAQRVPMRDDAIFRIYSMTKPLTSLLALQQVERGQLRLHDRVADLLPEAPWRDEARAITVLDLLRHTAGYTYGPRCADTRVREAYSAQGLPVNPRMFSSATFVQRLAQVPLLHPPGTAWAYGQCTDLLGAVVERCAGRRLGDVLTAEVCATLGLRDTGFTLPAAQQHRLAQPLAADPATGAALNVPDQTFDPLQPPAMDSGGAGALSTMRDYLRLARCLLEGGELDGVRLLQCDTLADMTRDWLAPTGIATPVEPGVAAMNCPGYGFGLGVAVRLDDGRANLPGAPGSYFWSGTAGTLFWVDPANELAAVYMSQAPGASRQHYRRVVMQGVYDALGIVQTEQASA